ncbi:DUF2061 domain-containing protein [Hankyongella ginsenosidimutans]|uniref:DUF2061 domain-containing protein n=1 Tax=Hankyongella ginsenosidimutans TaxID=1763828 RepID=A0A4D7C787_9SPHN|nr:DUF2061 domain-containing protein [Hankyongella ginsenosidimutans]QCI79008.1 DUF2061 domain-containing protein [Hankyongella ginsenosidimutans]
MLREILKVSGAVPLHLLIGIGVALAVTGSWQMAGAIAIIEPVVAAVVLWGTRSCGTSRCRTPMVCAPLPRWLRRGTISAAAHAVNASRVATLPAR